MPRVYNIKWRHSDIEKITNLVRSFNSKITRTINKYPGLERIQPERLSTKNIIENISTRQEFNRTINTYSRYLKRNAEMPTQLNNGEIVTNYLKREAQIAKIALNVRRTYQRKKRPTPTTETGTMGTIEKNSLNPIKLDLTRSSRLGLEKFLKTADHQLRSDYYSNRDTIYVENYIAGLSKLLEFHPKLDYLINKIREISPSEFVDAYFTEPALDIDFFYTDEELELKIDEIDRALNEIYSGF